jgi:hypothetical protein
MPGGGGGKGGGGGGTSTVNVNNSGTTNIDSDSTVEIRGLDKINTTLELKLPQPLRTENKQEVVLPQPFRTESRSEMAVTQPIVTESKASMALDVRPLTVDLCLKFSMGPLPQTCIRQPYHHHFGITMFGVELLGFTFSGESQVIIQDLPRRPLVEWGGQESLPHRPRPHSAGGPAPKSGLRITLER